MRRYPGEVERTGYRLPHLGFTLAELAIVVLILGILAGVALPQILVRTREAEFVAIVQHIQVGHDAAEAFFAEHGAYPKDAHFGEYPVDFKGYLQQSYFRRPVPGGGAWDWNGEGLWGGVYAGMSIFKNDPPLELWREIDRRYDDGNLRTGSITLFRNRTLQFELAP